MTRATNAATGVTRYLQVYTVLSQALAEGAIGAGEALPSEPSLVRQYGVSRTTVRRALARLAEERSIVRRRGSGTFARDMAAGRLASARQIASILDDSRNVGANTTVRLLAFKNAPTPDFLYREWPEFGATVLTIRKIRFVESEPVALVTTYVPERIGRELTARELGNDTVLVTLDRLGYRGSSAEQEASAVAADPFTAKHLDYGIGAPVLNLKRLARDSKRRIIEYSNYLYRPDRYEIHTLIERGRHHRRRLPSRP
ncbi:MAG: GntR family transcriptional regulator [Gammaproteobacteria bacterium]|nr:GntR family transcriptional regulator [Gammaproteobacteria bacterium]